MICKIAVASVKVIKSILSYLVHCFLLEKFVGYDFWRSFIGWWWLVNNSFDRRKLMSLLLKTSAWTGSKIIVEALQNIYYQLKAFMFAKRVVVEVLSSFCIWTFNFPSQQRLIWIWESQKRFGSKGWRAGVGVSDIFSLPIDWFDWGICSCS